MARLTFHFSPPTQNPFKPFPPAAAEPITVKLLLRGGAARTKNGTVGSGKTATIVFDVEDEDVSRVSGAEAWGNNYGAVAFVENAHGLAVGHLKLNKARILALPMPEVKVSGSKVRVVIGYTQTVLVTQGIAQYITNEINTNRNHEVIRKIADLNAQADIYEVNLNKTAWYVRGIVRDRVNDLRRLAEHKFARLVHTNEGAKGFFADVYFGGGGEWDHKPKIRRVWGARNRLGNTNIDYYYDIWSNIHYGYVGGAAAFSLNELLEGASVQQKFDSGSADEAADGNAISEGFALYGVKPNGIGMADLLAIVARHPEWSYEVRKKAWDKVKAS